MKNSRIRLKLFTLLIALALAAAFTGLAAASEFSADLVMSGGPMSGQGKVWVKGQKMRQDFTGGGAKMIMIMDLDKGYSWMLMPENKTYIKNKVESKGKGFRPENFTVMQQGEMQAQVKKAGTEKISGYTCDKYVITYKNKKMGSMTQWFAHKLAYPIKMIAKSPMMGQMVTELKNIKTGGVDDALFEIPAGYKPMQMPKMPPMPKGK